MCHRFPGPALTVPYVLSPNMSYRRVPTRRDHYLSPPSVPDSDMEQIGSSRTGCTWDPGRLCTSGCPTRGTEGGTSSEVVFYFTRFLSCERLLPDLYSPCRSHFRGGTPFPVPTSRTDHPPLLPPIGRELLPLQEPVMRVNKCSMTPAGAGPRTKHLRVLRLLLQTGQCCPCQPQVGHPDDFTGRL